MFEKARIFVAENPTTTRAPLPTESESRARFENRENSDGEDELGPALPGRTNTHQLSNPRSGPTIPNLQDLELQRGKYNARDVHQVADH